MELGVSDPVPALNASADAHLPEQRIWRGVQAGEKHVGTAIRLALKGVPGRVFHDPGCADPGLTDVLCSLFCTQRPGDVAAEANLVIACQKRDVPLSFEIATNLAVQRLLVSVYWPQGVGSLLPELPKRGALGMERIRLDEHALKIQLAKHLLQHRLLVNFTGWVACPVDFHAQCGGIQHDLSNKRRVACGVMLNRSLQSLNLTH
jgi:hypothetical protein